MDAAFFPHLRELDFKQEGWRLEHENPNGTISFTFEVGLIQRTAERLETY
jgi:hypothetical protein